MGWVPRACRGGAEGWLQGWLQGCRRVIAGCVATFLASITVASEYMKYISVTLSPGGIGRQKGIARYTSLAITVDRPTYFYLSIDQSFHRSIDRSIKLSIYQSINLSIYPLASAVE